ncbi:glutathione S-transferase [Penicillium verrucosum]|uniref:glutathione S-transferase n=1 Tax=Penicillium verrucosum TaxID=60171 RepID=UPI0025451F29|nr:glutathione S-transferase [Penicillium verrucosum]KAJ5932944.1 glutathione S-transferase [Penicillium verrucosum]
MSCDLTIHHLRLSQSERIIWLCEELGIPYNLKCYDRQPATLQAPDEYRNLHWSGTSPIIQDGKVTLGETNAIFEYILAKYANGQLVLPVEHPQYADYVFWLHRANGTMQPGLIAMMFDRLRSDTDGDFGHKVVPTRLQSNFQAMEAQLGKFPFLAGDEFTAADCISVFSLTTLRMFIPFSLEQYPSIVRYLERIGQRDAYKRAMKRGDPDLEPALSAAAPKDPLW